MHHGNKVNTSNPSDAPFSEWMSSNECSTFLDGCREKIRSRVVGQGLSVSDESLETGTLWSFMASRQDICAKVYAALTQNKITQARFILANYYLLHLIDRRRSSQESSYHSLYRKVRTILSKDPDFAWKADNIGSFYAHGKQQEELPVLSNPFNDQDNYQSIPDPEVAADCRDKEFIKSAAVLFYRWACEEAGRSGFVPVRELSAYLMTRSRFKSMQDKALKIISFCDLDEHIVDNLIDKEGPDSLTSEKEIRHRIAGHTSPELKEFAGSMVENWTSQMAAAFYYYACRGMKLEETAKCMGYKGASGVKYQLNMVYEDIRRRTAVWPLLSPPDMDDNVFEEFLEHVFYFCKQRLNYRN